MASLALIWIILSIIGTGIIVFTGTSQAPQTVNDLTPAQKEELLKLINTQSGAIQLGSGSLNITNTGANDATKVDINN